MPRASGSTARPTPPRSATRPHMAASACRSPTRSGSSTTSRSERRSTSLRAAQRVPGRADPQQDEACDRRRPDDDHGRENEDVLGRQLEQPGHAERSEDAERPGNPEQSAAHARDYPFVVTTEANYWSGEDYVVEFLGYRFGFNGEDFQQRVTAAGVKLGLLEGNELDEDETAEFGYRDPRGGRALLELAPVPSWHELQFRR